jgi:hypothetical protein
MPIAIPFQPEVWERTPAEAQAYIRARDTRVVALEATVQSLAAAIQHLEATVQQLREQLQQDLHTSSLSPSSDLPQALISTFALLSSIGVNRDLRRRRGDTH